MKRAVLAVGMAVAMSSLVFGGAKYVLKFSHVVSPNTPKGKAAEFFEKRVEELSKGQIDVQVYPNLNYIKIVQF